MAFVLYFLFLTNKEFIVLLLSVFYWCSDLSKHAACNHTHTIYHGIWGVFDRVQSWNEQHYVDGWHTHILVLLLLLLLLLPLVLRCAAVVLLMLLCCCAAAAAAARALLFFYTAFVACIAITHITGRCEPRDQCCHHVLPTAKLRALA